MGVVNINEVKEIIISIPISKGGLTEGQWNELFLPHLNWLEKNLKEVGIKISFEKIKDGIRC